MRTISPIIISISPRYLLITSNGAGRDGRYIPIPIPIKIPLAKLCAMFSPNFNNLYI